MCGVCKVRSLYRHRLVSVFVENSQTASSVETNTFDGILGYFRFLHDSVGAVAYSAPDILGGLFIDVGSRSKKLRRLRCNGQDFSL